MIAIAIDGPAGAGKSSVARGIARELGFIYVDTGALYRTIGLYARRRSVDLEDDGAVAGMLEEITVELKFIDGEQRVFLNGEDVSPLIRTADISMMASRVSALPPVRAFLLELQRDLARKNNVIMDGRDIGTVVLPGAQIKLFLTASPECRAQRRCRELAEKGEPADLQQVLAEIRQRDYNDSHRAIAPLKPAQDAQVVDNSDLTLQETIDTMTRLIRTRLTALQMNPTERC
ncbi:MAG: (d)CMP kinase [Firmicutes bacterium]|nr:(d)CMP kinase [Bacillota bacterium]